MTVSKLSTTPTRAFAGPPEGPDRTPATGPRTVHLGFVLLPTMQVLGLPVGPAESGLYHLDGSGALRFVDRHLDAAVQELLRTARERSGPHRRILAPALEFDAPPGGMAGGSAFVGARLNAHALATAYSDADPMGTDRANTADLLWLEVVIGPRDPDRRMLSETYGLTASEVTLCEALLRGETLAAAAKRCAVTMNTIRARLKAIFAKTGCHRQAELVVLLSAFR